LTASYIENHKAAWRDGGKIAAQWESSLKTYASPIIGAKAVGRITITDVADVLRPIWLDKAETASGFAGALSAF
jgi:hypothetical protein